LFLLFQPPGGCGQEEGRAVPLDKTLLAVLRQKQFWIDYFLMNEESGEEPVFPGVRVTFHLPGEHALLLRVYERDWEKTLHLSHPTLSAPALLARDTALFYEPKYVFRWQECAAVCRCLAARNGLRHPGWPLLLLYPFTTVFVEDDREQAVEAIREAWRWTRLLTEEEVERFATLDESADNRLEWVGDDDSGWFLTGNDDYSLRTEASSSFPFALFEDMLAQALLAGG
jgi:hypothetical protein